MTRELEAAGARGLLIVAVAIAWGTLGGTEVGFAQNFETEQAEPDSRTVARAEKVVSWLLELSFDEKRRKVFREVFSEDWRASAIEKRRQMAAQLDELEKLMGVEATRREVTRLKLADDLLASFRGEPNSPMNAFLLSEYAAAHPILAAGDPPLRRGMSDALVFMLRFAIFEAAGVPHSSGEPKVMDDAARALATRWPGLPSVQKERIAQAPLHFAALRFQWNKMPEGARKSIRQSWRRGLEPVLLKLRGHAAAGRPAVSKSSRVNMAELQRMLRDRHQSNMFMSRMLTSQHDASMAIIGNTGSSNTKLDWVKKPD